METDKQTNRQTQTTGHCFHLLLTKCDRSTLRELESWNKGATDSAASSSFFQLRAAPFYCPNTIDCVKTRGGRQQSLAGWLLRGRLQLALRDGSARLNRAAKEGEQVCLFIPPSGCPSLLLAGWPLLGCICGSLGLGLRCTCTPRAQRIAIRANVAAKTTTTTSRPKLKSDGQKSQATVAGKWPTGFAPPLDAIEMQLALPMPQSASDWCSCVKERHRQRERAKREREKDH